MSDKTVNAHPKRGEVYLVNFDPTLGSEIRKIRPAVILQNDVANRYSPVTIVAAVTSKIGDRLYPVEVMIKEGEGGLSSDSVVLLNQIRTIDRRRLIRFMGILKRKTVSKIDSALKISLGLVDL